MKVSRDEISAALTEVGIEWGDAEDAEELIDILLQSYKLEGVYTWLFFHNTNLGGTPLYLLEQGRSREVFKEARRLLEQTMS